MSHQAELSAQFDRLPGIAYRCRVTPDWPMVSISAACEALTGWSPSAFLSGEVVFGDLIEPEHRGRVWSVVQDALAAGRSFRVSYTIVDREGRRRWMWEQGHGVPDKQGQMVELEGLICDVTPEEQGGDELALSRHFIERVVSTIPGHVSLYDLQARKLLYSNGPHRNSEGVAHLDRPWRTESHFLASLHPDDYAAAAKWLQDWTSILDGEVMEWRFRVQDASGEWSWRWLRSTPFVRDADGKVRQVLCVSMDITAREQAVQALSDSEQRHRMIMEGASDGIFVCNEHLIFTDVNPAGCELLRLSREQVIGKKLIGFFDADDLRARPLQLSELRASGSFLSERRLQRGDGTWAYLEMHSRVLDDGSFLATVRDLTARKEAEETRMAMMREIMEAQRLESLGLISGGIAHDFNNLLATILGSAEVALQEFAPGTAGRARLERIQLASKRAADLTRQLLDFAGKGSHYVAPVKLDALLEEIPLLLEVSLGPDVQLDYDIEAKLPTVQGDRGRLQQLAMNLVVNASEAIGARPGVIRICMHQEHLDTAAITISPTLTGLDPGRYVVFEVEDDGCGIAAEQIERIFEPFYSTKGTGRGLGLAAVQGIVSGHGGAMRIDSVPARGTRVRVWLPAQSRRGRRFHSGAWDTGWQGEGRVLLVDDEAQVRDVLSDLVEALGFRVKPVDSGPAALQFLDTAAGDVAAVLLDVTMPTMDGVETWQRIAERWPDLPVVFISGMAAPECGDPPNNAVEPGFLMKPFSLDKLRHALQGATSNP